MLLLLAMYFCTRVVELRNKAQRTLVCLLSTIEKLTEDR